MPYETTAHIAKLINIVVATENEAAVIFNMVLQRMNKLNTGERTQQYNRIKLFVKKNMFR